MALSALRVRKCKSKVLVRLMTPALLARYEYQPPSSLSVVLPTRAAMDAHTAWRGRLVRSAASVDDAGAKDFLGSIGEKCFIRRSGPKVLIWKVRRASPAFTCVGDFSGCRMPGVTRARCSGEVLGSKRALASLAAEAIESSSENIMFKYHGLEFIYLCISMSGKVTRIMTHQ